MCFGSDMDHQLSEERKFAFEHTAAVAEANLRAYQEQPYTLAWITDTFDLEAEFIAWGAVPVPRRHRLGNFLFDPAVDGVN